MVSVDFLGSQLFALGFAGLLVLYMAAQSYVLFRRGKKAGSIVSSGAIPLIAVGAYMFISGMFGQLAWPLPGSYNVLFYDLYPLVGALFIAIGVSAYKKFSMQYTGLLSLLTGIMAILYGINGYLLGLTKEPLAMLALYASFGIAGMLGWPVSIIADRNEMGARNKGSGWVMLIILFCVILFLASILSLYIGVSAIYQDIYRLADSPAIIALE